MSEPLEIGAQVPHYGEVAAILWTGGERYYMLLDKNKAVALMPAAGIESMVRCARERQP